MRTLSAIVLAGLAASSALAGGAPNIDQDHLSFWTFAHQAGVSTQHAPQNAPDVQGDLNHMRLDGSLAVSDNAAAEGDFQRFFSMGAFGQFYTGPHAYSVEQAEFSVDMRLVNASPNDDSRVRYTITAGLFSTAPDVFENPADAMVFEIGSVDAQLLGAGAVDIDEDFFLTSDEGEGSLAVLPAFEPLYFGIVVELQFTHRFTDIDDYSADLLLEFGGDSPFEGLRAGLELQQLPTPGAAALFGLGAFAARRRR